MVGNGRGHRTRITIYSYLDVFASRFVLYLVVRFVLPHIATIPFRFSMSSKKARKRNCPGCYLEKSAHKFGVMSKFCPGPFATVASFRTLPSLP